MRPEPMKANKSRHGAALKLDLQRWRMRVVMVLVFGSFSALVGRALYLQLWQDDFLVAQADKRIRHPVEIPAHRGMVLDARGEPLAISLPVDAVWANPRETEATPQQIARLADLLGLDRESLQKTLANQNKAFVYLARQQPKEVTSKVAALGIPGISLMPEYRRYYPAGPVMAQVLGVTNVEDRGLEGIEYAFQPWLAGEPGIKKVIKDRRGNIVEDLGPIKLPKPGRDLALSLNLQIQYVAYREAQAAVDRNHAKAAAAIVVDAQSGELMAIANYPSYNPNARATITQEKARNRAVVDAFEPGSTMKPVFVATALEQGLVKPSTRIDTGPGWLELAGKRIKDTHPKGNLTVAEAVQVSSNVAMAKISLQMDGKEYWDMLSRAGFGKPPGAGLPGESRGQVLPYKNWTPLAKATLSYGHSLSASLLQLAHAYTAFANDGLMPPLTITKRKTPAEPVRVMTARTAQQVRDMLETVTQEGGTAPGARVPGYRVAGKTGTAHKLVNGQYSPNHYYASFVGMAPASRPRLVVAVVVDEPSGEQYYGGLVAAPVFSRIMAGALRFLALPPDAPMAPPPPVKAPIVTEAV